MEENNAQVQHLPINVNENEIEQGALNILQVIRPTWNKEKIEFKLLTDGISNKLVRCKSLEYPSSPPVLIRVYGNNTELLIDRKAEIKNILFLNSMGLAQNLFATFNNGLAYEFVHGCTLDSETVIQPKIYQLVAAQMAKMHKISIANKSNPILWTELEKYFKLMPDCFSDIYKQKKFEQLHFPKTQIQEEVGLLKSKLLKLNSPVVFAHNDLLLGNIVYSEESNRVHFIDFEYSALNYQAFDIGNHFTEFAGISDIDYSKYPSKEFQLCWLKIYWSVLKDSKDVSDKDIYNLYVQANQFALASHLWWGIWGLIQAEHSTIQFDYIEFAGMRFNEYFNRKDEFLALEMKN